MSDISKISNKSWNEGKQKIEVIRTLAEKGICTKNAVLKAARELQLSQRYIYKLVRKYRESNGTLTSLIPAKPTGGKGKTRLPEAQESIIKQVIERFYLTKQKLNPARTVEEVHNRCFKSNITQPSAMTIRRRIHSLSTEQLKRRQGSDTSREPIIGCFPEAEYPLSIVQIDHTLVDIILVDPIDRLPIGIGGSLQESPKFLTTPLKVLHAATYKRQVVF